MVELASNAGRTGTPDGDGNPICAAVDSAVSLARKRLWIAVPWIYSRDNNPWLLGFIERVAERARTGEMDVRRLPPPSPLQRTCGGRVGGGWCQGRPGNGAHAP